MSKGSATRQVILDHATREAAQLGLRGLSIGGLASGLGMSKSGLFAHFASKEALEAAVIDHAADGFTDLVIREALRRPRGEPRLRALVEGWLEWERTANGGKGCVFVSAAVELDDQPCLARDRLVAQQRDWLHFLAGAASIGVAERHFRSDLDTELMAQEILGIMLAYHHASRLLGDPRALDKARRSIDRLLADARSRPS
jgi:AcrR family transcriptional regulator